MKRAFLAANIFLFLLSHSVSAQTENAEDPPEMHLISERLQLAMPPSSLWSAPLSDKMKFVAFISGLDTPVFFSPNIVTLLMAGAGAFMVFASGMNHFMEVRNFYKFRRTASASLNSLRDNILKLPITFRHPRFHNSPYYLLDQLNQVDDWFMSSDGRDWILDSGDAERWVKKFQKDANVFWWRGFLSMDGSAFWRNLPGNQDPQVNFKKLYGSKQVSQVAKLCESIVSRIDKISAIQNFE